MSNNNPIFQLYKLSFLELWRNRFGMLLLIVIPIIFLGVVEWTSGTQTIPIDLFFRDGNRQVLLTQHSVNLVFIGSAVLGFLTAYYALILFHKNFDYYKYCIGMGLSPWTFLTARFLFFLTIICFLGLLTTITVTHLVDINRFWGLFGGFVFIGIIYGIIGGIFGLLSSDFMVAILGVVLLANLDAGWLQNPVFYSSAQETSLIQWLPAFFPTQFVFSSAFTAEYNSWALIMSFLFALALLSIMSTTIYFKVRNIQRRKPL